MERVENSKYSNHRRIENQEGEKGEKETMMYGNGCHSLSGSFRLTSREMSAMQVMRATMRMSTNTIADCLGRSKATVHAHLKRNRMNAGEYDNRGSSEVREQNRAFAYISRRVKMREAFKMFQNGVTDTFQEAMVSLRLMSPRVLDMMTYLPSRDGPIGECDVESGNGGGSQVNIEIPDSGAGESGEDEPA